MKFLAFLPAGLLFGAALVTAQDEGSSPDGPARPRRERAADRGRVWEALQRRFDEDGDGLVSRAEFTRSRAVFARLDRDRDGVLSEDDFLDPPPASPMEAAPADEGREFSAEAIAFFESRVRPVLAASCYECHSASSAKLRGGLRVDSRAALIEGGNSGAAIVPGDPEASLLVQAVRYADEDLQMPPKQRLETDVASDLARWVELGAPWPASVSEPAAADAVPFGKRAIDIEKGREFWSFQPPRKAEAPAPRDARWAWSEIDRFLLVAMEAAGVTPVRDADRRAWIRRVGFDLTGLPPSPEEIAAFEADRSPDAFEKVVDRLLASPGYGERWGRHWLDVARYAESSGKDTNVLYPHAWRYRDWVIASFRDDLAYDRFLALQLAGDLMPAADDEARAENLVATGFLALGAKSHNTRDRRQFANDVADEQIDAFSQGMLGLTVACARCHDHKFDPIPTEDYYALAGIFQSSQTLYGTKRGPGNNHASGLVELPDGAEVPNGPSMPPALRAVLQRTRDRLAKTAAEGEELLRQRTGEGRGRGERADRDAALDGTTMQDRPEADAVDLARYRNARQQVTILDDLLARFDEDGSALPANRLAMGVREGRPRDARVLERGEPDKAGQVVPRGFVQVVGDEGASRIGKSGVRASGRRELAAWVASASNPLTARVWVNRVWLHLFGRGIVPTADNFGASGQPPSHPELLDWLAVSFVEDGWSTKALVRRIVLSHAYRLAAEDDPRNARIDPEAVLLWRMPERRLEAEAIRDAMLLAAGTLQLEPSVGSPVGALEGRAQADALMAQALQEQPVRSVYLPILRDRVPEALEVFDAADPSFVTGDREETNVATQALFLMNAPEVLRAADALAERLLREEAEDGRRIERAFQLTLGRSPSSAEREAVRRFLREFPALVKADAGERDARGRNAGRRNRPDARRGGTAPPALDPRTAAWSAFAQSLFQCAEFRYLG